MCDEEKEEEIYIYVYKYYMAEAILRHLLSNVCSEGRKPDQQFKGSCEIW